MANDSSPRRCRNPECQIETTGICFEGHAPIESCPHRIDPDVDHDLDDEELDEIVAEVSQPSDSLSVHSGEALSDNDVRDFLRWRPARKIAILGDLSSGKTTLLCGFYDRLLRGDFAGISFVGSLSLVALEQRIHHSREASGAQVPDTKRTSITDGLSYYHFALAPIGVPSQRTDLLLSDRAGEAFQRARDNVSTVPELSELSNAERVVLLLDGARVVKENTYANATHSVRQLLRALLDGHAINRNSDVQIVTTKVDLIHQCTNAVNVKRKLFEFQENLKTNFSEKLRSLSFLEIAARPKDIAQLPIGLEDLLRDWTAPSPIEATVFHTGLTLGTEFDKLLLRTPLN